MFDYNGFYDSYSKGSAVEKQQLLEQLKIALYFDYSLFFISDRDTASDFLCHFFLKLKTYVDRFQVGRAKFFTYMSYIINKNFHTFKKTKNLQSRFCELAEKAHHDTMLLSDDFKEFIYCKVNKISPYNKNYDTFSAAEQSIYYHNSNKLHILKRIIKKAYSYTQKKTRESKIMEKILICKYTWNFPETKILYLCQLLDLDTLFALEKIAMIREKMDDTLQKQKELEQKINEYFYRIKTSRALLEYLKPISNSYKFHQNRKEKSEQYLKQHAKTFLEKNLNPNSMVLSEVLDLSYSKVNHGIKRLSKAFQAYLNGDFDKKNNYDKSVHKKSCLLSVKS